jgi:pyrophosphate--fructose-6-phosphate 1-phosphotransferase
MSNQYKALTGTDVTVAMMTSGGLAPCLSASIAQLVKSWVAAKNAGQITGLTFRMYKSGYKGMLTGDSFILPESDWDKCESLLYLGGSPIGNSRVKVRDTFRRRTRK